MYIDKQPVEAYIDALINEIKNAQLKSLKTIYIGGGTPSAIEHHLLERLLIAINKIDFDTDLEFTIEANPDDVNDDFIKIIKKYGINRISVGVQDVSNEVLTKNRRDHTFQQVENAAEKLKIHQFPNVSYDFIVGLPGQSIENIKNNLKFIANADPEHISVYTLMLESHTILSYEKYDYDDDEVQANFDFFVEELVKLGYSRYEISNFCKTKQSKHNLVY